LASGPVEEVAEEAEEAEEAPAVVH